MCGEFSMKETTSRKNKIYDNWHEPSCSRMTRVYSGPRLMQRRLLQRRLLQIVDVA